MTIGQGSCMTASCILFLCIFIECPLYTKCVELLEPYATRKANQFCIIPVTDKKYHILPVLGRWSSSGLTSTNPTPLLNPESVEPPR